MYRLSCVVLIILFSTNLAGCSFTDISQANIPPSSADYPLESEKPDSTIDTVTSENEITENTISYKPTPSPSPTLAPTPNDGRTVIADGFYYKPLDDEIKAIITGSSYPVEPQNNITYESLNYVSVLHYNFEGEIRTGELIVADDLADEITRIFYQLYLSEYPLTSIKLIDEFGGSVGDRPSMSANNTSAFNYRLVAGTNKLSNHALGRAIDINPMINPYVKGDYVSPKNGREYADRSNIKPGMIDKDDLCYTLFTEHGWSWGGDWVHSQDYQHFEKD